MKLSGQSKGFWILANLALVAVIGIIDYATTNEISLELFYLIPISLTTWFIGRPWGVISSIFCTLVWLVSELLGGVSYPRAFYYLWNVGVHLGSFLLFAVLLAALKKALDQAEHLARTDYLTGAINRRFFIKIIGSEFERLKRYLHPLTLIFLDLDNFKTVNDTMGHAKGDELLVTVVKTIKLNLRATDQVARIGGDEFAILLPETGAEEAEKVVSKVHEELLQAMHDRGWPVTFSIGVLTCLTAPARLEDICQSADGLMYSIKHSGKHGVKYAVYEDRDAKKVDSTGADSDAPWWRMDI